MGHPRSAGRHLILDGYVNDPGVFTRDNLTRIFAQLVTLLEMTVILGPEFVEVPVDPAVLKRVQETGKFEDEGGITGFAVISTSHMALHAWPLQGFFSMDVFSCKEFDARAAEAFLTRELGIDQKHLNVTSLHRIKPPPPRGLKLLRAG